jgi:hypothetical protein
VSRLPHRDRSRRGVPYAAAVSAALVVSPAALAVPVAPALSPAATQVPVVAVGPVATARWSSPASPAACASALSTAATPLIVFPSSNPQTRSGPGALAWTAPPGCRAGDAGTAGPKRGAAGIEGGTGAAAGRNDAGGGEAFGSPVGEDDLPGPARPLATGGDLVGIAAATGTALGQVVVAGAGPGESAAGPGEAGVLVEGSMAAGSLRPAGSLDGPSAPLAAFSAFLGDAVVVSSTHRPTGWDLAVRVQRHYSDALAAPLLLPAGPRRPRALTATMDYRGEVLVVWAAAGGVFAREVAQSGAAGPPHMLGSSSPDPELQALTSDDGRAMVAWRSQTALPGGGARTSIELSITGPATTFGRPRMVERFDDPRGPALPPRGSLRLVRLSSEAVMMAWTGVQAGRYVVRASPVSLRRGAWAPVTISVAAPATPSAVDPAVPRSGASARAGGDGAAAPPDAVLAGLVPGPRAEALAVWTSAPRLPSGASDPARRAILAARGHFAGPGRVVFGAPETIAPPGPNGTPAAAFDPHSDRALAAWVTSSGPAGEAQTPRIVYSLRSAGQAAAGVPVEARSGTPPRPLSVALLAGAALLAMGAAAWLAVGRRHADDVAADAAEAPRGPQDPLRQ